MVIIVTPSGILYSRRSPKKGELEKGFVHPPAGARPFTWWHWINGNVTKEGITRDLEAMAAVGLGGFQAFSADSGIPSGPAEYLTPLWIDLMRHAAEEANRLELEFDMHNCMGWSSSGGSWITPELSMQQLVWSEQFIRGGEPLAVRLKEPFRRMNYYRDAYVIAFPTPEGELGSLDGQMVRVTLEGREVELARLGDFTFTEMLTATSADSLGPGYLRYDFNVPFTARSVSVNAEAMDGRGAAIVLEASDDGTNFRVVAELSELRGAVEIPAIAVFPDVTAAYFRLRLPEGLRLLNVRLSAAAGVNDWLYKANYPHLGRYYPEIELEAAVNERGVAPGAVDPGRVIDLTDRMNENGELNWEPPPGHWTILRFGHTTTGVTNRPAEGRGWGLECDKYSAAAFEFHFYYMLDHLQSVRQALANDGSFGMLIDSHEVDVQNWTKLLPEEFGRRRGYDLLHYLPALAGRMVVNANTTERFLWDFRRTCADMMTDHYQGRFTELCSRHGIVSYTEPYNRSPFEQMQAGAKMDVNLGEFWLRAPHFVHSLKLAASIQNLNGRQIVAAEAYTGRPQYAKWQSFPYAMKAQGDFMMTRGLNRFIFHRYAHQPHPTASPGMTMGQWGFHFERTNTWFHQGKQWLEYLSRCQYVLQQGVFVGDILCFTGEEAPGDDISMGALRPHLPEGYDFQFVNREVLLDRVEVVDGEIRLPDGLSFRLLLLPDKQHMTMPVLSKLAELVAGGMVLVGPRPLTQPTLAGLESEETAFRDLTAALWGKVVSGEVDRKVEKGRVLSGLPLVEVVDRLGWRPDFYYTSRSGSARVHFIHRRIADGHIYFLANRNRWAEEIVAEFRLDGYAPDLWDTDTGTIRPLRVFHNRGGSITVPLHLGPAQSVLLIFRPVGTRNEVVALLKEGEWLLPTVHYATDKDNEPTVSHTSFTVSFWIKPETDEVLPKRPGHFGETTRHLSSYPIYAPPGAELFGPGHATLCVSVARNGVAVFEKEGEDLSAVLVEHMPLSSWIHLALVYVDGRPLLYLNGILMARGEPSAKVVHPVVGAEYPNDKLYAFDGEMSRPKLLGRAVDEAGIMEMYRAGYPNVIAPASPAPLALTASSYLFWENGEYEFRSTAGENTSIEIVDIAEPQVLVGPWTVLFPKNLGAPERIELNRLTSLHLHSVPGVKYFSGTASYRQQFIIDEGNPDPAERIFLDLGRIAVIAEVVVNAQIVGTLWKPPYLIDITQIVAAGVNELEVRVTNLWPNRLIGDEQLPVEDPFGEFRSTGAGILELPGWYRDGREKPVGGRVSFATWRHFDKDSPLLESGLIGPVSLRRAVVRKIPL